jgi:hypothetical protein
MQYAIFGIIAIVFFYYLIANILWIADVVLFGVVIAFFLSKYNFEKGPKIEFFKEKWRKIESDGSRAVLLWQVKATAAAVCLVVAFPFLFSFHFNNDAVGGSNKAQGPGSESSGSLLTRSNLINSCNTYKSARYECASASNVSNCIEIKIGATAAGNASRAWCDSEGNPNLWLLPKSEQ